MPVVNVTPPSTPNAGRVNWNESDNYLETEIDAQESALTAHKTSADHDGRYYTESEVNASQGAQDTLITANANNLTTHKSSSDHDARYYTETEVDAVVANLESLIDDLEAQILQKRQAWVLQATYNSALGKWLSNGVEINNTIGMPIGLTGCIRRVVACRLDGQLAIVSGSYDIASDRAINGQRRISVRSESMGAIIMVTIDGNPVNSLAVSMLHDTSNVMVTIVGEYA